MGIIILTDENRIATQGHNSRGNQLKFKKDNIWYKTDSLGYEGLSEYIVSYFLQRSNIENFVMYEYQQISYNGQIYNGCKSENFLPCGFEIVTADKLFHKELGKSVHEVCNNGNISNFILSYVETAAKLTGLSMDNIGKNLTSILELDALFLNDDRHFNNLAFLWNGDRFFECPIFDNGAALLSDKMNNYSLSYDMYGEVSDLVRRGKARPFSEDFEEQRNAAISLFGSQLEIYTKSNTLPIPKNTIYDEETINRARRVLEFQIEKNMEYFPNIEFYEKS